MLAARPEIRVAVQRDTSLGLRNLSLAALEIAIVWITILWAMKAIWPHHRWIAPAQIPYLIWVTIASVLQFTIT